MSCSPIFINCPSKAFECLPHHLPAAPPLSAAVRFPDGSRGQRRFPRDAPLAAVHDWCLSRSPEAAGGRPFFLSEALPGAAPLADLGQTLEAADVADAMLVMKWSD